MGVRLDRVDEYLHELGPEPTFNESMYFNVYDPTQQIGGFFRLGNRPNEGTGEMTACLYLPDGSVAFMFRRPEVRTNESFDAAGMRFAVIEPFEELTVDYRGKVVVLSDPAQMADPKVAFTTNPSAECLVSLRYRGLSAMVGGEPEESRERPGEEFARGHYEQLVGASGLVAVGDQSWEISGFGLRDHSWGPRTWQAPWYYRWLTANFADGSGFMGSRIARKEGPGTRGGFVWDGTALHLCQGCAIETGWSGEDRYHETIRVTLASADRTWRVNGRVLSLIPLRNRREGLVTRISEGLTEWTLDDGKIGYGLSEYLDQMIDGQPVGLAE